MARTRNQTSSEQTLTCPECGRTFTRAAALGAHRRAAHGVAGASRQARSNRQRTRRATSTANATPPRSSTTRRQSGQRRSAAASSDGRRRNTGVTVDRDRLLKTLFPNGIPASVEIIRAVNSWLDDAERLAQMKV
jgi:uncharacterized C2H2 Zn-finger protein